MDVGVEAAAAPRAFEPQSLLAERKLQSRDRGVQLRREADRNARQQRNGEQDHFARSQPDEGQPRPAVAERQSLEHTEEPDMLDAIADAFIDQHAENEEN